MLDWEIGRNAKESVKDNADNRWRTFIDMDFSFVSNSEVFFRFPVSFDSYKKAVTLRVDYLEHVDGSATGESVPRVDEPCSRSTVKHGMEHASKVTMAGRHSNK